MKSRHAAADHRDAVGGGLAARHGNRVFWFNVGIETRAGDPAFLVRGGPMEGETVVRMRN